MKDFTARSTWLNVGLLVVIIIGAYIGLGLVLGDVQARAQVIANYHRETAVDNANLAAIAGLQGQVNQAATYTSAFNQLLPNEDGLVTFPSAVTALGSTYGVSAQATFSGDPTAPTSQAAGFIPFSLNVSGSMTSEIAFLKNMETDSSKFLVVIDSFDMETPGGLSATGRVFFQ